MGAEITAQHPEQRIGWTSTTGSRNGGVVPLHPLDDEHTRVVLQLDFYPEGFVESAGDVLGAIAHRAKADLERFRTFIESRETGTGEWRGDVPRHQTT